MRDDLERLWRYRILIQALVARELKARYRGSVLGFLWSFLNPLLLMVVYALVFSVYMRFDMENYSVFLFTGLLPWLWFSSSLLEGTNSIITGSSLVRKVMFPPEVLPITAVLSNLMHFFFGMPILFVFIFTAHIQVGAPLLFLPVIILVQLIFTLALTLLLSSLSVHYRDISQILTNLITLWFFLCPIIYSLDMVAKSDRAARFLFTFKLNPMAYIIEAYHDVLLYNRLPMEHIQHLGILLAASIILFFLSYKVFNHFKRSFAEEV
ncbi:ABC transporter permease [bacterium]|nr:ABC transporter permease [candidate division CSSED10-310 bacterium]